MSYNALEEAALEAAYGGAPPAEWEVSPDTTVRFGSDPYNPFHEAVFTHWIDD